MEVLATILSLLPRTSVPALALLLATFSPLRRLSCTGTSTCAMFGIPTHCGYSSSRDEISLLSRTLSVSLHGRLPRLARISYPAYSHAWTTSGLIAPSFDIHILRHHSAFGLRHIEFGNTHLSGQAEGELIMWLDGQTNVVSLRLPFLIDDDDDDASPHTPLPATPTGTRLLSAPTTPSEPFLFPMPRYHRSRLLQHRLGTRWPILPRLCCLILQPSRPSTSSYPPRAFSTSNRRVYHHFQANLCWFRPTTTLECLLHPFAVSISSSSAWVSARRKRHFAVLLSYARISKNSK